VLAAYTQLRLARQAGCDQRLPWERPQPQPRLSPYRVRRGFPRPLCAPSARLWPRRNPPDAPPRPAQGPALWACDPVPGDQEARQEAEEEAAHDREGRLTRLAAFHDR